MLYHLNFADLYQCLVCDQAFLEPQPTEDEIASFYNDKDYHSDLQPRYFSNCHKGYSMDGDNVREYLEGLNKLEAVPDGKLLDVGCATGIFLDLARKRGWNVKGVELSKWASDCARNEFHLDVFTGTLQEASLPEKNYDVVTAWDILEHLLDPASFLREASKVLKPGGTLLLNTIGYRSLLNYLGHAIYKMSFGTITYPLYHLYGIHHLFYFSNKSLRSLIERNGFEIVELSRTEYCIDRIDRMNPFVEMCMRIIYYFQNVTGLKTSFIVSARRR